MQYDIKPIKREINILKLSEQEYDALNKVYKDGLKKKDNKLLDAIDSNLRYVILTDGYYRVELEVET